MRFQVIMILCCLFTLKVWKATIHLPAAFLTGEYHVRTYKSLFVMNFTKAESGILL